MADVNIVRAERGQPIVPLVAFVHGTALLMFRHEMEGSDPDYPARFYPRWIRDRVFDDVRGVFVISNSQKERFLSIFSDYDPNRIFIAPNGIDPAVFHVDDTLKRDAVLSRFPTKPYEGSSAISSAIPTGYDRMVLFVGKFADIKRIDCLLRSRLCLRKSSRRCRLERGHDHCRVGTTG